MIRLAVMEDLENIMEIIEDTVAIMHVEGNTQWDKNYPMEKDFQEDIEEESLYAYQYGEDLAAVICLNKTEPKEYQEMQWRQEGEALVIHRMAVSPHYRQKGIARELMKFADELALSMKSPYLKTDTYSMNPNMNYLFESHGYLKIGEMNFWGKPFKFCVYDKLI